jgi:hypothetical protein
LIPKFWPRHPPIPVVSIESAPIVPPEKGHRDSLYVPPLSHGAKKSEMTRIGKVTATHPFGVGFCQCGCGDQTRRTESGYYLRFVAGHEGRDTTPPQRVQVGSRQRSTASKSTSPLKQGAPSRTAAPGELAEGEVARARSKRTAQVRSAEAEFLDRIQKAYTELYARRRTAAECTLRLQCLLRWLIELSADTPGRSLLQKELESVILVLREPGAASHDDGRDW